MTDSIISWPVLDVKSWDQFKFLSLFWLKSYLQLPSLPLLGTGLAHCLRSEALLSVFPLLSIVSMWLSLSGDSLKMPSLPSLSFGVNFACIGGIWEFRRREWGHVIETSCTARWGGDPGFPGSLCVSPGDLFMTNGLEVSFYQSSLLLRFSPERAARSPQGLKLVHAQSSFRAAAPLSQWPAEWPQGFCLASMLFQRRCWDLCCRRGGWGSPP